MGIDDIFDMAGEHAFAVLGVAATFTPAVGDAVSCSVVISDEAEIQPGGFDMGALAQVRNIEARLSELEQTPEAGDTFAILEGTYSGTTFTVGDELENDGRFVKVAVR